MSATGANRPVAIASPLGDDVLLFHRMEGREQLGRLFEYQVDVYSEDDSIDFNALLGENVTVRLYRPELGDERYFNGFVSQFHQGTTYEQRYATYQLTRRPWFWFLTRTSDCRIFQEQTVPDIVKQIFRDRGFSDFEERLSGSYRTREYCVQYRETDFDFIS
ncbi:MAG: type VI secretion system tip protein VgrG, partial [Candidatus Competibacterales bacterium]|nr:type VI secretion system tip protein VgrG [Candidatus Competibacterales bacterium]